MGWSWLSVLNLLELQHFLRTQLHLVGLIYHKTQGRPLWKIPWTQMWREALRNGSASCEKEHVYCVWHMTFKERGGGKRKKHQSKKKNKSHKEDKGKEKTGNRWWLVLSQLFRVLLSHKTKKRSHFFPGDLTTEPAACDLNYQMLCWTRT